MQFELFLTLKSDTSRTGQYKSARHITDLLRTHSGIRRTMPDRIRSRPTAHRTHRQLKCSAALAHSHCLRRFYHARTVAECKYPFPTFIAYFTYALCETRDVIARSFEVIAHLWAGTAHRPTIGNNVTPDPIFNCQVSVFFYLFISGHPFVLFICNIIYHILYYTNLRRMSSVCMLK